MKASHVTQAVKEDARRDTSRRPDLRFKGLRLRRCFRRQHVSPACRRNGKKCPSKASKTSALPPVMTTPTLSALRSQPPPGAPVPGLLPGFRPRLLLRPARRVRTGARSDADLFLGAGGRGLQPQGGSVTAAVRPRGEEEEEPRANRRNGAPEVPGGVAAGCGEEQNEVEPPGGGGWVSPADPPPVGGAAGGRFGSPHTRQRSRAQLKRCSSVAGEKFDASKNRREKKKLKKVNDDSMISENSLKPGLSSQCSCLSSLW